MKRAQGEHARSRSGGQGPLRTCAVTRLEAPQEHLLRFVCGPDGSMVPDLARKLPGRGVWVGFSRELVEKAVQTGAFARSLKQPVRADAGLPGMVETLLISRLAQSLSLANKAGAALGGFEKVDAAIAAGRVRALLHGSDASEDGTTKLDRRYKAMCRDSDQAPHIERSLSTQQMSLALGRANVVHAALQMGGAARSFLSEAGRLQRYRTGRQEFERVVAALVGPTATPDASERADQASGQETEQEIQAETGNE